MIIPNSVNTLIFDLGGVIYNIDINLGISNFKKLGFKEADQFVGTYAHHDFFVRWETGKISIAEFRDEIRKRSNQKITDEEIDYAWGAVLKDIPKERIDLLLQLRKKYRLFLLSNTNPYHTEICTKNELAKYGLSLNALFDRCFLSYQMGIAKPNPEIFLKLLQCSGIKAEECLFLDDGQKNIDTAAQLGFHTYLVKQGENLDFLINNK